MPVYEYQCRCGARTEVLVRSLKATPSAPDCPRAGRGGKHALERVLSRFARHLTFADQTAEAEAKFGKQVNAVMGPGPDVGRLSRRYDRLTKDLPRREDL